MFRFSSNYITKDYNYITKKNKIGGLINIIFTD